MPRLQITLLFLVLCGAAARAEQVAVLLLPFGVITEPGRPDWLGQAVQQNILNELGRTRALHPVTLPDAKPTMIIEEARRLGRDAGASLVVFGTYQNTQAGLRITGQVLDVESGKLVGGMKATGSLRDLFFLEDTIAQQARRVLMERAGMVDPRTRPIPEELRPTVQQADPIEDDFFEQHRSWPRYWGDFEAGVYRYRYTYPTYFYPAYRYPVRRPLYPGRYRVPCR